MTNPKIDRVKISITKTKATIADYQAKLRELERQKIQLENDEIVALFRREKLNEDEFAELLRFSAKDSGFKGDNQSTYESTAAEETHVNNSDAPVHDDGKEESPHEYK